MTRGSREVDWIGQEIFLEGRGFKQIQLKLPRGTGMRSEELMPGWKERNRDGVVLRASLVAQ